MLKNRNILCTSIPAWKSNYASTIVELMKKLGSQNKVLYVQNPYTIKDLLGALIRRDKKFPYRTVLGLAPAVEKHSDPGNFEVYVLTPPLNLTINFLPTGSLHHRLLKINGWIVRRSVRKQLKKLGMTDDLIHIVAFNPLMGVVNGRKFSEKILVYHCYDEIGHSPWMKNHGAYYEEIFLQSSDAVIVTSQGLYETKKLGNPNCYLVRNGADTSLFSTAFQNDPPQQKTVGFIGSFDDRIDYEMLEYLAQSMPGTQFRFIGRVLSEKKVKAFEKYKNVHFTGPKSLQELPAYVKDFSVGIIPFVKNEFTKGIYPLKINEYLAAGIPVVATDFSYLHDFKDIISIAANKEDFMKALEEEMNSDNVQKRMARREIAKNNSWDQRAEELSVVLETIENKKSMN